jgi:4-amino-4-deoxy-L-arabinose transferase-like glycosyltransferase
MFWVALAVRVAYMTLAHMYRMRTGQDHFQFGWEMGRIARALATGYGYADPFTGHSGPTAWAPPLYPLLLAGVFKVFGVYSLKSGWVILFLNCVFSAGTVGAIYEIGQRCFGPKVALWSGWLWALHPAAMQYAVKWVWDMSLTAFLFAWVLVLALRIRGVGAEPGERTQTTGRWVLFGVIWGLIALSNSSLLLFLPACGLWMVWGARERWMRNAALAAVCCGSLLAPWVVRNSMVFHAFVPLRSNLGAELYETAKPENEGFSRGTTVSLAETSADFQRYKRLGELNYSREQGVKAMALFRADKKLTVEYFFKRIFFYWVSVPHGSDENRFAEAIRVGDFAFLSLGGWMGLGLALRRKVPGAWLFFWAFLLTPVVYYVVTVQARFRHPIEPVITVLIVYLFQSAEKSKGRVEI